MALLSYIILAYLIGSIPTSIWISKFFFGVDIRDYGTGNAGATNTYRVLGSSWGVLVMVIDVLKGVAATSLYLLIPHYYSNEVARINLMIGLGIAALSGHIFPVLADFKGGKGVATLLGIIIAVQPVIAVCFVSFLILIFKISRWLSVSPILTGVACAVLFTIYEINKNGVFQFLAFQFL